MIKWMYKWLPIIFGCHCRDDRSFHYKGHKFPICARCTGELIGIIAAIISAPFYIPNYPVLGIMLVPILLDGGLQLWTKYESNNIFRVITGFLAGYGAVGLFLRIGITAFTWGLSIGKGLRAG